MVNEAVDERCIGTLALGYIPSHCACAGMAHHPFTLHLILKCRLL